MNGYLYGLRKAIRKHGIWITALLAVTVFFGLFLFGEADAVIRAITTVEWWRVGAVFSIATVSYGIRFLKWEYYLRSLGIEIPIKTSLLVFISGLMMVITPGKGGEVWKAWFLRDLRDVPLSQTTSIVGAERVTDLLALAAFALLGLFVYERSSATLLGVTAFFLTVLLLLQWRTVCLRLLGLLERTPLADTYVDEIRNFYESTYTLFRPRQLGISMGISLVAWGLEGVALWIILDGFTPGSSIFLALFVFGFGSVVGAVSLLPGGLAAAEASMVGMLIVLGYSRTTAVGSTLIIRVGTLWYGAALGTSVFFVYRFLYNKS